MPNMPAAGDGQRRRSCSATSDGAYLVVDRMGIRLSARPLQQQALRHASTSTKRVGGGVHRSNRPALTRSCPRNTGLIPNPVQVGCADLP